MDQIQTSLNDFYAFMQKLIFNSGFQPNISASQNYIIRDENTADANTLMSDIMWLITSIKKHQTVDTLAKNFI
jgi:hypothetical protein